MTTCRIAFSLILMTTAWVLACTVRAQCPPSAVQDAVGIHAQVARGADAAEGARLLDALAATCAASPHVQLVAAAFHGDLMRAAPHPEAAHAQALIAWKHVEAMRRARGNDDEPVMVMIDGNPTTVDVWKADSIETAILESMFSLETSVSRPHPDHAPASAGDPPRPCGSSDAADAQVASWFIRRNLKHDMRPALAFLDRVSESCAPVIAEGVNARILGLRAAALLALISDDPRREGVDAMMATAVADSKRFFEIRPGGDTAYWSTWDRDRLQKLVEKIHQERTLPPESEWFKAGNAALPSVVQALATKLDEAWAKDAPRGSAGAFEAYRGVLTMYYAKASTSDDAAAGKRALALAAKGHSDGTLRGEATKSLPVPPGFLWKWIDPSVLAAP